MLLELFRNLFLYLSSSFTSSVSPMTFAIFFAREEDREGHCSLLRRLVSKLAFWATAVPVFVASAVSVSFCSNSCC